ncbi:STAS domain-containing protein [Solirubrobacter ginsenosidimutans]|uniref:Anti-sigma factor antagonist n=1 Tax=Solirubrobacter ginsenosidimutans TaxID=490573 RepID=A0A9X3N587_9ACTN|nr:STAS domain-containing protein [Solirubrobacter ginsenosidimutans]MDA0167255.1 STAS domain-containing protein [Solirubrobacter ginsenosidimutans]
MSDPAAPLPRPRIAPAADEFLEPGFACPVHDRGDTVVLAPSGELDAATVGQLEHAIAAALDKRSENLTVDLRALSFIDSSGVRALLRLTTQIGHGARLRLVPGPPQVQRVFELTGLTAALPFTGQQAARSVPR